MIDLQQLCRITRARTGRASSWDRSGRNQDYVLIEPGETHVMADLAGGPGVITHLWMTQDAGYRDCLLRFTWDDAKHPSVLVPLGDFFCLGNNLVNSFQSLLFTCSTTYNHQFNRGAALNCYAPMPFRSRARLELINQGKQVQRQFYYVDYERTDEPPASDRGYFHAEFRRANPFHGWGQEIAVNTRESNIVNDHRLAWDNNYVVLETRGHGHYIGCNLSVSNFKGGWWGEGDDMIWVDGYKWPPDLHGTGSEDYLNQAWGMHDNAFLRNGSSVYEGHTLLDLTVRDKPWEGRGGYQTSYVFHVENPVRFQKDIKVTIEHGHGNHLANEMSSVAYWYADRPARAVDPPPVAKRQPVLRDNAGNWLYDPKAQWPGKPLKITGEMRKLKKQWVNQHKQK